MEVEDRHEDILPNSIADADLNDLCYLDYVFFTRFQVFYTQN